MTIRNRRGRQIGWGWLVVDVIAICWLLKGEKLAECGSQLYTLVVSCHQGRGPVPLTANETTGEFPHWPIRGPQVLMDPLTSFRGNLLLLSAEPSQRVRRWLGWSIWCIVYMCGTNSIMSRGSHDSVTHRDSQHRGIVSSTFFTVSCWQWKHNACIMSVGAILLSAMIQ